MKQATFPSEKSQPTLGGSPLDWDLLLKANRCLNWLSSAGELSVLYGCFALWSSVKPGPIANFLVRMDLSFYIAEVSHLFTPNMNAIRLETIVFMNFIWLHHFYDSLSTALSVSNKLTLNVLRNESQFEIWGSYFEAISYPLVPKLTLLAYWIPILLELWFWSIYSWETWTMDWKTQTYGSSIRCWTTTHVSLPYIQSSSFFVPWTQFGWSYMVFSSSCSHLNLSCLVRQAILVFQQFCL